MQDEEILTPSWETAARIFTECMINGENPTAKQDAQKEILKLARAYDKIMREHRNGS